MPTSSFFDQLPAPIAHALEKRGYTTLTAVQEAVLTPDSAGRDLRISSQTGSGKTVALGLVLRDVVAAAPRDHVGIAAPWALVVTPTRELAKQVEEELSWLYAAVGARVVSVTGGTSVRDERRALATGPAVVVGTPGRLLDHLTRAAIDPRSVGAVVLDEADRMLDMGFREDLEAILKLLPPDRRTHLVSATFAREVRALADRVQQNPLHVEGTRLGEANADIEHVVHVVLPNERMAAIVNLLLDSPGERTLLFARTRADVADIAEELGRSGFSARGLSGEMEQPERLRVLNAFKRGKLRVLVATDVAARGLDIQDVARVLHAEPPADADAYTHRSGRTGRAGRKGRSAVLAAPGEVGGLLRVMKRAGVTHRFAPVPTAADIRRSEDERLVTSLSTEEEAVIAGEVGSEEHDLETGRRARLVAMAKKLVELAPPERIIARLLDQLAGDEAPEPRAITTIEPPRERSRGPMGRDGRGFDGPSGRGDRGDRDPRRGPQGDRGARDPREAVRAAWEPARAARDPERLPRERISAPPPTPPGEGGPREGARSAPREAPGEGAWVAFRVSWGSAHGADPRRLLALVCRRGDIRGTDVGAIRIGEASSVVEVARSVGAQFAEKASQPDPRDPRVRIRLEEARAPGPTRSGPPRMGRAVR